MNNPYGYKVDITKPKCRELYEEREEFERYVLGEMKGERTNGT